MEVIQAIWNTLNALAPFFFLLGLLAIGIFNYRVVQRIMRNTPPPSTAPAPVLKETPHVTAIVPAWNEAPTLEQHINSFKKLRYPQKELILIAGGKDSTFEVASKCADSEIKVIAQQPGKGKQVALRDGLEHATGEIIYLTDADCHFDDDSFERTLAPLINDGYVSSTGSSIPFDAQFQNPLVSYQYAVAQWAQRHAADHSPGLLGRNCAVKTDVLKQTGGFDTPAPTGTDYTLARQLILHGHNIKNVKQSLIATKFPDALKTYYHKHTRWLRNEIYIGFTTRDYPQAIRALRASVQGGILLISPLIGLLLGPFWLALSLLVFAHAIASRIRYILLARYPVPVNKPVVCLTAAAMLPVDLFMWAASLLQIFNINTRSHWR